MWSPVVKPSDIARAFSVITSYVLRLDLPTGIPSASCAHKKPARHSLDIRGYARRINASLLYAIRILHIGNNTTLNAVVKPYFQIFLRFLQACLACARAISLTGRGGIAWQAV